MRDLIPCYYRISYVIIDMFVESRVSASPFDFLYARSRR
jgi:hypothetical protein